MLVSYKVCHGSAPLRGPRNKRRADEKAARSGRDDKKIQWRGEPHATVGGRYISLIQTAKMRLAQQAFEARFGKRRYIARGSAGAACCTATTGKMRTSVWARLSDAPTTSDHLGGFLWGEIEVLVVEAESASGETATIVK